MAWKEWAEQGNALFQKGLHAEAIKQYDKAIPLAGEEQPNVQALLYCNRAAAHYQMELYRRCLNDCTAAIKLDKYCLRAYLRKGHALVAMGKEKEAAVVWKVGASLQSPILDIEVQAELQRCVNSPSPSASSSAASTPKSPHSNGKAKDKAGASKGDKEDLTVDVATASSMLAARGLVQHGIGNATIDEKIAMGYLQVNTGNFAQGIAIFNELLAAHPRIVAAYLGRGTAFALAGHLNRAVVDFTSALAIDEKCVEAWKRRGQSRAAMGNDVEALNDLARAIELNSNDHEIYHQRGLIYYKLRNYRRAKSDFEKATILDSTSKLSWNHLGLCLNATGGAREAINIHKKAAALDASFKENWANLGQAYKELGNTDRAEHYLSKAISIDSSYVHGYYLRGLTKFSAGEHRSALMDFDTAVKLDPTNKDCRHMRGIVAHGLGLHEKAIADYTAIISRKLDHIVWYNREIALYTHSHLDVPACEFNMDRDTDPSFKEAWCKRLHPQSLASYSPQSALDSTIPDVTLDAVLSEDAKRIVDASREIGVKLQLNCAGYTRNKRQHRACGLAVFEIAQTLSKVWRGELTTISGKASSSTSQSHSFGWRDLYDIPIRWRQFSEPNDPVWWVDLLTPEQFAEGFGSHTPMITGQTYVVRYSPMFKRAFAIMKGLLQQQQALDEHAKKRVAEAKECADLHAIMKRDFWVVTPCYSTARPGKIMEGTRLTLQASSPEGFEYAIRTPGTPPRWQEYDYEMTYIFELLKKEASSPSPNLDRLSDLILKLSFYWYNFMPLSRGTAAVGYMSLLGMFLSVGIEITSAVPEGQQVDWEGILRPTPEEFIAQLKPWMYPSRKPTDLLSTLPSVSQTFSTPRKMIEAMNAP
ncbi:Suppressor of RPS4-RLD 1 [Balamuthia mandrillaris]